MTDLFQDLVAAKAIQAELPDQENQQEEEDAETEPEPAKETEPDEAEEATADVVVPKKKSPRVEEVPLASAGKKRKNGPGEPAAAPKKVKTKLATTALAASQKTKVALPRQVGSNSVLFRSDDESSRVKAKVVDLRLINPGDWHLWITLGEPTNSTYEQDGKKVRNDYFPTYRRVETLRGTPYEGDRKLPFYYFVAGARSVFRLEAKDLSKTKSKKGSSKSKKNTKNKKTKLTLNFRMNFRTREALMLQYKATLEGRQAYLLELCKGNKFLNDKLAKKYTLVDPIQVGDIIKSKEEEEEPEEEPEEGAEPKEERRFDSFINWEAEWDPVARRNKMDWYLNKQQVRENNMADLREITETDRIKGIPANLTIHSEKIAVTQTSKNIRLREWWRKCSIIDQTELSLDCL